MVLHVGYMEHFSRSLAPRMEAGGGRESLWFLRPFGSKRPFGVERDMLFISVSFPFQLMSCFLQQPVPAV